MTNSRQSNLELLRIVAMLMVVIVHLDGAVLGLPEPMGNTEWITTRDWWRLVVEAITIIGVNCFTLISGYFGIRASVNGFVKFTFQCLFYAVLIYTTMALLGSTEWSWATWGEQWLVFSHTDLWYVPAYLGLYLLSPFINAGIESMSRKRFATLLIGFIIFNVWLGWIWGKSFNPTGYTVIQLVMVYLIGRFIALHCRSLINAHTTRWYALYGYIVATTGIVISAIYLKSGMAFAYNSPLVLIASIAFFVFFATLRFHSNYINFLAGSAFSVYLLHKNPFIWVPLSHDIAQPMWDNNSLLVYTIFVIFATATIFSFSSLIDQSRKYIQNIIFRS